MFTAYDRSEDRLVDIDEAIGRGAHAYECPCCGGGLIIKNGDTKAPHFAHRAGSDCDDFTHDMSEWHRWWQRQFPVQCREVPFELGGKRHRADIAAGDFVIEFQHSPISAHEFWLRNRFYNDCGKVVYWVFDLSDQVICGSLQCTGETSNGGRWSWERPWKRLRSVVPQSSRGRVVILIDSFGFDRAEYRDNGTVSGPNGSSSPLERIVWAIERNGGGDYTRFITRYYPSDASELKEFVKQECCLRRAGSGKGL